ncbi:MAG: hypothetical protein HKN80_12050 [Acidimicrobiia bacterium]|nr:hypothetical protein [Acidimicrobiia bacterium]
MPSRMKRSSAAVLGALVLASCSGEAYQPSYGFIVETYYENGIPAGQQSALADGLLTEAEVVQAAAAADACVAAVSGVSAVEEYRWVEQDGEFVGGRIEIADEADRDAVLVDARACYFQYVGLIEFAWLDQWYFGEWTEENLRG